MKLRWLRQASASLDAEYEFIRRENPKAARHVFSRVTSAVMRLKDFRLSGCVGHVKGTRELVVAGVPYLVIYRVTSEGVEILRVFRTRRDYPAAFQ